MKWLNTFAVAAALAAAALVTLCDRVGIMNRGEVRAIGSPAELKATIGVPHATLCEVLAQYSGGQSAAQGKSPKICRS